MQQNFYEEDFVQKTKESHNRQFRGIQEAATEQLRSDLEHFGITKQLPQDKMHTLREGVVQ